MLKISLITGFLNFILLVFSDALTCPLIFEHARLECGYPGITEGDCVTEGCCWDEHAQNTYARCYERGMYYVRKVCNMQEVCNKKSSL